MAGTTSITATELRAALDYDPETGIFTWRFREGMRPQRNARFAGKRTGYINARGYCEININCRIYLGHRLAWLHMYGAWPPDEIDHINGDPTDNRISNLRLSSRTENLRNTRRYRNNASGFKGVTLHKGRWRATIGINGVQTHLGLFASAEAAHDAYCLAASRAFGKFANNGS